MAGSFSKLQALGIETAPQATTAIVPASQAGLSLPGGRAPSQQDLKTYLLAIDRAMKQTQDDVWKASKRLNATKSLSDAQRATIKKWLSFYHKEWQAYKIKQGDRFFGPSADVISQGKDFMAKLKAWRSRLSPIIGATAMAPMPEVNAPKTPEITVPSWAKWGLGLFVGAYAFKALKQ